MPAETKERKALWKFLRRRRVPATDLTGIVDEMRSLDAKIVRVRAETSDGTPLVVLIGLENRADDLEAAYAALGVNTLLDVSFDPPVKA